MGLLMSDTTMIDPLLDEVIWARDAVGAWAYALDATPDDDERAVAGLSEWTRLTSLPADWAAHADL